MLAIYWIHIILLYIVKQSFIHKYLLSLTPARSLTVLASAKPIGIATTTQKGHRHAGPLPSVGVPHQNICVSIADAWYPFTDISQTNALWPGFVKETRFFMCCEFYYWESLTRTTPTIAELSLGMHQANGKAGKYYKHFHFERFLGSDWLNTVKIIFFIGNGMS